MFHLISIVGGWLLGGLVAAVTVGLEKGDIRAAAIVWGVMLPTWAVAVNIRNKRADEEKRASAEQALSIKLDQEARRKIEQQAENDRSIAKLIEDSISLLERIPSYLASAEKHLDRAEFEFKERAFAPFWDAIESAIRSIGSAKEVIETISRHSRSYESLARESLNPIQHFPITPSSLQSVAVVQTIATRLRSIVRNAQSDFEFSTIYEQRKTNSILVAGFQSLSDAVNGIGGQIINAITALGGNINELSSVLESRLTSIDRHTQDATSSATKSIDKLHGHVVEIGSELQQRHDRALEMLDNIQRRRKPDGTRVKDFWTKPV